jgi:predicted porin
VNILGLRIGDEVALVDAGFGERHPNVNFGWMEEGLRSLGIKVVLVHGIGQQIQELSVLRGVPITNNDGTGVTDAATLDLAIRASARVSHLVLEGLTQNSLKAALTNAVRALPVGIIKGVDQQLTGKVERVDRDFITHILVEGIVPIIQPIGFGPDGKSLRINSDLLAAELAEALLATKIIYLSPQFFGFDFGASYAPNSGEGDRAFLGRGVDTLGAASPAAPIAPAATQRDKTGLENEISAALRYRGTFGGVGIAASFAYMQADAPTNVVNATSGAVTAGTGQDVNAYSVGLNLSAFGLTVGGEYTWGKYSAASVGRAALSAGRDESSHWLLGATYVMGAFSVGAYYGVGTQDNGVSSGVTLADREQTGFGIGVAYTVAPGLEVFANYNQYEDKNVRISVTGVDGRLQDRDFSAFFLGTRLAF